MMNRTSQLFLALLSLAAVPAWADDSLECALSRSGSGVLPLNNKIVEKESTVQDTKNELQLRVDASLARSSFFFVMQDDAKQQRIAFSGAPSSLAWDGARIAGTSSEFRCQKKSSEPVKKIENVERPSFNHLVCLLDEAVYEGGAIKEAKRVLQTVNVAQRFRLPLEVKAEDDKYSFSVSSDDLDPVSGLELEIRDKSNGEVATFAGPPKSLVSSFMLGFTQGDKTASAKFLRLGCVYTNDPKLFLEEKK